MASTPSSSDLKYNVFLSFRGEDTRQNFTSHLYTALCRKHVSTFIDDELPRGQKISPELLKIIEQSKISIIIFSENYANSSWCLDELVKIMKCKEEIGQIVVPIFYHVDPSDVRKQMGGFGEAFEEVKEKFRRDTNRVQNWIINLTEAANLSGWHCNGTSSESKLCEEIASHIESRCPISFITPPGFFGVDSIMKRIISDLCIGEPNIRCIGIWGIGGIGKTTVAELVYQEIVHLFDLHCFFSNVTTKYDDYGPVHVRERFYSNLGFNTSDIQGIHILPTKILKELRKKKVLVVLDNVSETDQVVGLGVSEDWFGQGSRIIITSRDKQVLNSYVDGTIHVKGLDNDDSLKLLKKKSFPKKHPEQSHMSLIGRVVDYCKGVPLALTVLGSHLCQRTPEQWEIVLNELEQNPNEKIMGVLQLSYDSLSQKEKDIFLDVACCFQGYDKDRVTHMLNACGFHLTEHGLMCLEDKCLITIKDNVIKMHDLIEEMGRHIAKKEGSRLFDSKQIDRLRHDKGNEAVEVIWFYMHGMEKIHLDSKALSRMPKLRILIFHHQGKEKQNVKFIMRSDQSDHIPCFSRNLRFFYWMGYPFKSLPSRPFVENLVELSIQGSNITQLWDGVEDLGNLKKLNLSGCRQLMRLPNLSLAMNLNLIKLTDCKSLVKIDSWIKYLKNLMILELSGCKKLKRLPNIIELESLKVLLLNGCSSLKMLPDIPRDIKVVNLDRSGIKEWPLSTYSLRNLCYLSMDGCQNITEIPSEFLLNFNAADDIDSSYGESNYFLYDAYSGYLRFQICKNLDNLPEIKGVVKYIHLNGSGLQELPPLDGLCSFRMLKVGGCSELVRLPALHGLSSLKALRLDESALVEIPIDIAPLRWLERVTLSNCMRLESLPQFPNKLRKFDVADGTTILTTVIYISYISNDIEYEFHYKLYPFYWLNLGEKERSRIMLKADRFVKKLAIATKTVTCPSCILAILGSEIPEWVKYQSQEPSLAIHFPQNFFDTDNFLGFAFYVVLGLEYQVHGNALQSDYLFVFYKRKDDLENSKLARYYKFIPTTWENSKTIIKKFGVRAMYEGEDGQIPSGSDGATTHDVLQQRQKTDNNREEHIVLFPSYSSKGCDNSFPCIEITLSIPQHAKRKNKKRKCKEEDLIRVQELPSLDGLNSLETLFVYRCSKLVRLPDLHGLSGLTALVLDETVLVEVPNDIASLQSSECLTLRNCKQLKCLPKLPDKLRQLHATGCRSLTTVASTSYMLIDGYQDKFSHQFYYVNCLNLVEEERFKIMLDAQQFVKKLAIAFKTSRYKLTIPGSEIPEWVKYQSQEPSLAIHFCSNFFDADNFFRFSTRGLKMGTWQGHSIFYQGPGEA